MAYCFQQFDRLIWNGHVDFLGRSPVRIFRLLEGGKISSIPVALLLDRKKLIRSFIML